MAGTLRRSPGALLGTAAAAGLVASLASLVYGQTRPAGTGAHQARGWPRSFLFSWKGMDGAEARSGINWLYLAENWLVWAALAALLLFAVRGLRRTPS